MKCSCCGNEVSKTERYCSVCGENNENYEETKIVKTAENNNEYNNAQQNGNTNVYFQSYNISTNQQQKPKVQNSGLATAAKIFCVLGCVLMGFCYLIPLAWCIPMTVAIFGRINRGEPVGVGLKVCTLLFLSLIGGILLLCMNDEPKYNQS